MQSYYERLVAEKGETAAKEYMRSIRAKVTKHPGGSFKDKTFAKAMSDKAAKIKQNELEKPQDRQGR